MFDSEAVAKKQQCVRYTQIPFFRYINHSFTSKHTLDLFRSKNTVIMIQFQTTIIYRSIGGHKNKLYIKSAALETNMSSICLKPSLNSRAEEKGVCVRVCGRVRYLQQASAPREV